MGLIFHNFFRSFQFENNFKFAARSKCRYSKPQNQNFQNYTLMGLIFHNFFRSFRFKIITSGSRQHQSAATLILKNQNFSNFTLMRLIFYIFSTLTN